MVDERGGHHDAVYRAMADPTRRAMMRRRSAGERTIGELADPFQMSLAAASKHVKVLERAGLVGRTVAGRSHRCRLQSRRLGEALKWLSFYHRFWTERFVALVSLLTSAKDRS